MATLRAGAAAVDISPRDSQFLYGYPHVERFSTGIHDPLLATALFLTNGRTPLMFISNDIIFVGKTTAQRTRRLIEEKTGIPGRNIMITATHTHSGPKTVDYISNEDDPAVPKTDPRYLRLLEDGILAAATAAYGAARPAEIGLTVADGTGVGTNRRDPIYGPSDPQVPVLAVRSGGSIIACMVTCSMHPTVLHEDSTLVTADFPGVARRYLQENLLGPECPVLYHTGPAGNQSVRYMTRENSFPECERLGTQLGKAIAAEIPGIQYTGSVSLAAMQAFSDLPRRALPSVTEAQRQLKQTADRLAHLRQSGAPAQQVRRAEVDWFGAEESLTLARAAAEDRMEAVYQSCLPAEVQVLRVGPWSFVGWPGEIFVEYALAVKARCKDTFLISLANGELQGYIATEAEAQHGGYEVTNAVFSPETGNVLVRTSLELLAGVAQSDPVADT
jgi:neutral ceramidase